jgi:hypothetical protein
MKIVAPSDAPPTRHIFNDYGGVTGKIFFKKGGIKSRPYIAASPHLKRYNPRDGLAGKINSLGRRDNAQGSNEKKSYAYQQPFSKHNKPPFLFLSKSFNQSFKKTPIIT